MKGTTDEPRRRVVITGAGALGPGDAQAGTSPEDALDALWTRLAEGRAAFRAVEELQFDRDAEPQRLARSTAAGVVFDPREHLDGNYRPVDRTGQLAIIAAQRALASSGWSAELRAEHEVGLVMGTMFGSVHTISAFDRRGVEAGPKYVKPLDFANSVINAAAGQAAIWLDLRGPNSTVTGGAVAGLQAFGQAAELIRSGRSDALLAGGADELAFESFFAFQQAGLVGSGDLPRPYDVRRDGFVPGEGAAFLMLEAEDLAVSRGARILGEVSGHGTAFDPSCGRDRTSLVRALVRAVRQALGDTALGDTALEDAALEDAAPEDADPGGAFDFVSAGGSGLRHTDAAEALALGQVLNGRSGSTPVTAVKSTLGESLGAAGAFQALAALGAFAGRPLPGVVGFEEPDPELPTLDLTARATGRRATGRRASGRRASGRRASGRAILTSLSFDGLACAVVLESAGLDSAARDADDRDRRSEGQ